MRHHGIDQILRSFRSRGLCFLSLSIVFLFTAACTRPGATAPSTVPLAGTYVELGPPEENSSCGYTLLVFPLKNPRPVSQVIDQLIKRRGGEALIEITSSSSSTFYGVGVSNCVHVRGKVVNFIR